MRTRTIAWAFLGLGICALFLGCYGIPKSQKTTGLRSEENYGEIEVPREDFKLPEEAGYALKGQFAQLEFLEFARQALRVPMGIKQVHLVGDQLVVQSFSNQIWCLDAKTLVVQWTWTGIIGELDFPPTINSGSMYFIARDRLYAVDRSEGSERWRMDLPFAACSAPTAAYVKHGSRDYYLFIGGWDGSMYCIGDNIYDGFIAWYAPMHSPVLSTPLYATIGTGTWMHCVSESGDYMKFLPNRVDNKPHRSVLKFERGSVGPLVADSEKIYVASKDYRVYAVSPLNGLQWVYHSQAACETGAAIEDGRLYVRNTERMMCLDAKSGELVWENPALDSFVVKLKRYCYFLTLDGRLAGVSNVNNEMQWMAGTGPFNHVLHSPDLPILFCATQEGYILAFEEKY